MPILVQPTSVRSVFLEIKVGPTQLATATGFVVVRDTESFLVTNRHVVTGVAQDTGKVLWSNALPDRLLASFWGSDFNLYQAELPLIDVDQVPLWTEHPTMGRSADLAAVRLPRPPEGVTMQGYDLAAGEPRIQVTPSDMLSIIGFPFGLRAAGLPVWSAGFVASEPMVDFDHRPVFLIDSRTRPGQSGSPVVAHRPGGMVALEDGNQAVYGGAVSRLMGIYSGRISAESDLGLVWKRSSIAELIEAIPASM